MTTRITYIYFLTLVFSSTLLADSLPEVQSFSCNDGQKITVQLDQFDAWLFLPRQTVKLRRGITASGAKYSDQNITFWSKGKDALLIRRGEQSAACIANNDATAWEIAKLDGADFRAVGNEPGWELLLFDNAIIVSADYGAINRVFKHATVYEDKKKKTTTYEASKSGHSVKIVLSQGPCTDTMSDETFETKVFMLLDGKEKLNGCGKALH